MRTGLLCLLTLCASAPVWADDALAPGDHTLKLVHGARARTYLVHVPPKPTSPAPVVLVFHGGGGNGPGMRDMARMDEVADAKGFLAVYPEGTGRLPNKLHTWNAGTCCGFAHDKKVDDVGYVVALLKDLAGRIPVDNTRVYATGLSNGAMMSYRLAADASDRIAAIAPVAGAMVLPEAAPTRPVPVLHIHSVDDPRALYEGGLGPPFPLTNRRVQHPPVQDAIDFWAKHDGCPPDPRVESLTRGIPDTNQASHTAQRFVYGPGKDGAVVVLWKLTKAGHVWPGGKPTLRPAFQRLVGPPTDVIDASSEIWEFFARFSRPDAPPLSE